MAVSLALAVKNEDGLHEDGRLPELLLGGDDRPEGTVLVALPGGVRTVIHVLKDGEEDGPERHQVGSDGLEIGLLCRHKLVPFGWGRASLPARLILVSSAPSAPRPAA